MRKILLLAVIFSIFCINLYDVFAVTVTVSVRGPGVVYDINSPYTQSPLPSSALYCLGTADPNEEVVCTYNPVLPMYIKEQPNIYPITNAWFYGWGENCSGTTSYCNLYPETDLKINATFYQNPYSLANCGGINYYLNPQGFYKTDSDGDCPPFTDGNLILGKYYCCNNDFYYGTEKFSFKPNYTSVGKSIPNDRCGTFYEYRSYGSINTIKFCGGDAYWQGADVNWGSSKYIYKSPGNSQSQCRVGYGDISTLKCCADNSAEWYDDGIGKYYKSSAGSLNSGQILGTTRTCSGNPQCTSSIAPTTGTCNNCVNRCNPGEKGCSVDNTQKWDCQLQPQTCDPNWLPYICVPTLSSGCYDKTYTSCPAGCSNGNCITLSNNGVPSNNPSQCLSGYVADGVCCDTSCTQTCKSCNLAGHLGTCYNDPYGISCLTTGTCDGSGNCNLPSCNLSSPSGTGVSLNTGTPTIPSQPWVYDDVSLSPCSWRCSSGYIRSGNSCIPGTKVCQSFNVSCQATIANITSVIAYLTNGATRVDCNYNSWTGSNAIFNCDIGSLPVDQIYNLTCAIDPSKSYQVGNNWSTNVYIKDCGPRCGDGIIGNTVGEECDNGTLNTDSCIPPNNGNCTFCDTTCKKQTLSGLVFDDEVCPLFTVSCDLNVGQVNSVRAFIKTQTGEKDCEFIEGSWQGTTAEFQCNAAGLDLGIVYPVTCSIDPERSYQEGTNKTMRVLISDCGTYCGDNNTDISAGETCDDGNLINDDGCSSKCLTETYYPSLCGDRKIFQPNENCDDGYMNGIECIIPLGGSCSYCNDTCQNTTLWSNPLGNCANNVLDTGEQCELNVNCTTINNTCVNESVITLNSNICNDSCVCVQKSLNVTLDPGFKCSNGTFIPINRPCNSTTITYTNEPGKCLENQCCYGLSAHQDGICVSSVPAGADADSDSCLCSVSVPGKFGNICDTDGESPCWETTLGKCCGNTLGETWSTTFSTSRSLYEILVTGICKDGTWKSRDNYLTYYTLVTE